jgi:lipopolysaccharide biosynthesis glycosyltransferase
VRRGSVVTPLQIYIGYDRRESEAVDVCTTSLLRRSSVPLHIVKIDEKPLRQAGIYQRTWYRREDGQRTDSLDDKPFSTDFAFTRFLVPALCQYRGWALFCDGDFLFTADISELFSMVDDRYAVMCIKHEHVPDETVKMDGQVQSRYRRKNWSSLCLYNCEHPANDVLTLDCVNKMPGSWLHAFDWLTDDKIGSLPKTWNHLAGVDPTPNEVPCGIHYTLGIPTMSGYENGPFADLWRAERDSRRHPASGPLPSERLRALTECRL